MDKLTYEVPAGVEVTIRRPSGQIDLVVKTELVSIHDRIFAQIVEATRAAGRGEALSYRNLTKIRVETDEDYAKRTKAENSDRSYMAGYNAIVGMSNMGESDECTTHGRRFDPSHKGD